MAKWANSVGIDVSKATLDLFDHTNRIHVQVSNNPAGFKELIKWTAKANKAGLSTVLFCFEHTGIYSLPLAIFLTEQKLDYAMVPGLEIKYSMGITRGKNDKVDARRIAEYAYLRREEITLYKLPSKHLLELKALLSLRERMSSHRAGYQASKKEMGDLLKITKQSTFTIETQQQIINELNQQIKKVDNQIKAIIDQDEDLKKTFDLVTSVKGVGLILGATMLVYTNCFTTFTDWRKFASYSGIAPFDHQSGTSIHGTKKVHHFANKRLKGLLSNAASSCIRHCPEMRLYYERRINEGKHKMSAQNIVRNKIAARVFAVVKRGTPYVDILKYAA